MNRRIPLTKLDCDSCSSSGYVSSCCGTYMQQIKFNEKCCRCGKFCNINECPYCNGEGFTYADDEGDEAYEDWRERMEER